MPRYILHTTATATIAERWTIEAESPDHAREMFENHSVDGKAAIECLDDRVEGDEQDREIASIELDDTPAVEVPSGPTLEECREAITDLYWLWKWYRDAYPDAEPPAELVKFTGSSDVAGRAFRCIYFGNDPRATPQDTDA